MSDITNMTVEQAIQFVANAKNETKIIDNLYKIYQNPIISSRIGWFKSADSLGFGGSLTLDFYEKVYELTDFKNAFFPFMPGESQTDEMLLLYLQTKEKPTINNYHGDSISLTVMKWIIDNQLWQINHFKEKWWTNEFKKMAIEKEPFAITFIPEKLLTKEEILHYLKNITSHDVKFLSKFWKNIPDSFKIDSEIFSLWLSLNGGLKENYKDIYSKSYFTFEGLKKYFILGKNITYDDWGLIPYDWKEKLIEYALPYVKGAIAIDANIKLTDDLVEKTLKYSMSEITKAKLALKLLNDNKLTPELIKKINLAYSWGIDGLMTADKQKLLNNDDIIDFLIKTNDTHFLNDKIVWKLNKINKKHVIDIIILLKFSYNKIKKKILSILKQDDNYLWVYFETNKFNECDKLKEFLQKFVDEKEITISEETLNLLKLLDLNSTYDDFKNINDIFLF